MTTHSTISFKAFGVVFDNPFPTILHYEDAICDSTLGKILVNYLRRSSFYLRCISIPPPVDYSINKTIVTKFSLRGLTIRERSAFNFLTLAFIRYYSVQEIDLRVFDGNNHFDHWVKTTWVPSLFF